MSKITIEIYPEDSKEEGGLNLGRVFGYLANEICVGRRPKKIVDDEGIVIGKITYE